MKAWEALTIFMIILAIMFGVQWIVSLGVSWTWVALGTLLINSEVNSLRIRKIVQQLKIIERKV